jgi:hypothetical protein
MNDSDENPYRRLEPLDLHDGDRVAIDGPIAFSVRRQDGRWQLLFAGVESTDVQVRRVGGEVRVLRAKK